MRKHKGFRIPRPSSLISQHLNPHAAGRSLDHPLGVFDVAGVEIGHFQFDDVFDLGRGHGTDLFLVGDAQVPLAIPAACLSNAAAGGLLVAKSNVRSL